MTSPAPHTEDAPHRTFTPADGDGIQAHGQPMVKKPNPVWLQRIDGPFTVQTNEGPLTCPDGYVAYDPISGHVWPVDVTYVAQHYEPMPTP